MGSTKSNAYKRRKKRKNARITAFAVIVVLILLIVLGIYIKKKAQEDARAQVVTEIDASARPELDVELLTINEYSRPGTALEKVNGIVIHYTANPGSSAIQNRDYFEGLKDTHITKASSHFVVGIDGEIVQCIPTAEIAYASNSRNNDTLSIECCHLDETGEFTQETYDSLVRLTAYLVIRFQLTTDDVIRHYDVTGKMCPKYYVEHEDAWEQFKEDVDAYILENS